MSAERSQRWFLLFAFGCLTALPGCFAATCQRVPEEICANGIDDDEDGLVDCADPDCAEEPTCVAPACRDATCMPGSIACDPATGFVEECNDAGDTLCFVGTCGGRNCVGGQCTPIDCIDGWTRCVDEGTAVQLCAAGIWIEPVLCDPGETCLDVNGVEQCVGNGCEPGEIFCIDDDTVGICAMDGEIAILNDCEMGTECVAGACVATSCPTAAACAWYVLDLDNSAGSDLAQLVVQLVNPTKTAMDWAAQIFSGGSWTNLVSGGVAPGEAADILLPDRHIEGTGIDTAGAYRIVTNVPANVYVRNGLEPGSMSASMTALWPESELSFEYIVLSVPHTGLLEPSPSGFAVVATTNNTMVTILPAAATAAGGGVPALGPLEPYSAFLEDGDVLQVVTAVDGDDLTGSRVLTSGARVMVYAFSPCHVAEPGSCDQVGEVMPPVGVLGLQHYIPLDESVTSVRIAAPGPAWIQIEGSSGVSFSPSTPFAVDFGIPAQIDVDTLTWGESLFVLSDAPVVVGVVDGGPDPSLTVIRPVSSWLSRDRFLSTTNAATFLGIHLLGGPVLIDGAEVGMFIGGGPNGSAAASLPLTEGAFPYDATAVEAWGRILAGFPPATVGYDIHAGRW